MKKHYQVRLYTKTGIYCEVVEGVSRISAVVKVKSLFQKDVQGRKVVQIVCDEIDPQTGYVITAQKAA